MGQQCKFILIGCYFVMVKGDRESPLIVIGMHRSGTTMMVGVLEKFGWFMGSDQEANKESKLFIRLNTWLMMQSGCRWDSP